MQNLDDIMNAAKGVAGRLANSAADIGVFSAIRSYVSTRIDYFMYSTLSNFFSVIGAAALSIMTVWIMIQGVLIVAGRSQEEIQVWWLS